MNSLNLLIIESHTAVRRALATRLQSAKGIEQVDTVATIAEALSYMKLRKPDVVLLGLRHPLNEELKFVIMQVRQLVNTGSCVLVLASYADELEREALLQAGAQQYLLKTIDTPHLIQSIEKAVGAVPKTAVSPPFPPMNILLPQPSLF
ncbi:MAG: response regulator transcription factor [Ardenticatenaceae bacterium]|nr:response regulator transcription factor [Ardenticatenaceae bacterium]